MYQKRTALPKPPRTETAAALAATTGAGSPEPSLLVVHAGLPAALEEAAGSPAGATLAHALRQHSALEHQLDLLNAEIEVLAFESKCGLVDDTQDVEHYDGTLGVSRDFVEQHERAVGQLQWLDDLDVRFSSPGETPGTVSGQRWGSGGLIDDDVFLTAGHCFDQVGGGWKRPSRNGSIISPREIARLMRVNFLFQINGETGALRDEESFPIVNLLEYRVGALDYAIVRLGPNADGLLPGAIYGTLTTALQDLTTPNAMLCMIQHPSGKPKKIEAGPMLSNQGKRIMYDSLDTEGGSSGAPVLGPAGDVVGVHTNGGCSAFSGANFGVAIGAIREKSSMII